MHDIIRAKESELREMQQTQLEEYLTIIIQLKQDYEYNLKLCSARDVEIQRLESDNRKHVNNIALLEQERGLLLNKVEENTMCELERLRNEDRDKAYSQVRLLWHNYTLIY